MDLLGIRGEVLTKRFQAAQAPEEVVREVVPQVQHADQRKSVARVKEAKQSRGGHSIDGTTLVHSHCSIRT